VRSTESRRQGRQPAERVERSESLDDGEASARINDVMAADVLRGESLRTAAVRIQWMYPRTCDRARGTLRRSVEKQSSLPASRRTLAKRSRRSVRNIGPSTSLVNRENRLIHAPDTIIAARVADLPDTHDAHFITPRFSAKTTVSRRSRILRIHDGVQRQASRRDACSSRRGQLKVSGKSTRRVTRR
jgi:hypothetical protein